MSIKSKVFAAAATLTLVGSAGAGLATSASAATPSCGNSCINWFSRDFGTHRSPNFALDTLRQGEKVGQPQILFRTSNSDPALDYTISEQGLVSDFFAADLVSAATNLHYGSGGSYSVPAGTKTCFSTGAAPVYNSGSYTCAYPDFWAYEIQYAPFGVDSGLCVGVAATAVAGEKVTLQPCGVSSKTVWIEDWSNAAGARDNYVPLINGSNTNFSQPYVLTYPASSYPTDMPRAELYVTNLSGFSNGSRSNPTGVNSNQLFGYTFGELP